MKSIYFPTKNNRGAAIVYVMIVSALGGIWATTLMSQMRGQKKTLKRMQLLQNKRNVMSALETIFSNADACKAIIGQVGGADGIESPSVGAPAFKQFMLNKEARPGGALDGKVHSLLNQIKKDGSLSPRMKIKKLQIDPPKTLGNPFAASYNRISQISVQLEQTLDGGEKILADDQMLLLFNSAGGKVVDCVGAREDQVAEFCWKLTGGGAGANQDAWDTNTKRCKVEKLCSRYGMTYNSNTDKCEI